MTTDALFLDTVRVSAGFETFAADLLPTPTLRVRCRYMGWLSSLRKEPLVERSEKAERVDWIFELKESFLVTRELRVGRQVAINACPDSSKLKIA